jgi:S-adenosylmethionine hydrolase
MDRQSRVSRVVTIASDFGVGSPYVAAMKARVLAECPDALLVDLSHSIPAFDVVSGAFVVWAGTRHFQPGAVHLAVVDPGVGGARRPVAFAAGGSWYVGPDNGLFGLVLAESPPGTPPAAVELTRPPQASPTFEGRDVFAPAAGALAAGRHLAGLGRPLTSPLLGLPLDGHAVLWVDAFGNVVTNVKPPVSALRVGGRDVRLGVRTFGDAPPGVPFFYVGSMGFVEVAVREARADVLLGARSGTPVVPERLDPTS